METMETRSCKKVRTSTNDESSDEAQKPIQKIDEEMMSDKESNQILSAGAKSEDNIIQHEELTVNKDENGSEETQEQIQKLNELLAEMDIKIDKVARTASSKQEDIEEYCSSLRCKVDAHSETMIEEIRKWNEKMRDEINDYERQCLEQFNAEEFKASSDLVKSTLSEMNDLQSRIRQQLVNAQSDAERINDLIAEASSKLVELKKLDYRIKKLKFTESMLDFDVGKKEFDPSNGARLGPTSMVSRDRMFQVSTISNMQGFQFLLKCFINPFASPHELIAIVENKSYQMVFVKMDLDGKILMQKTAEKSFSIERLQITKQGFIFEVFDENEEICLKFLDYDFNEMKLTQEKDEENNEFDYLRSNFTTNQNYLIRPFHIVHKSIKYSHTRSWTELRFSRHDSSEICASIVCNGRFEDCLATDKYLFVWCNLSNRETLEVYDIEHIKVDQEDTGEHLCSDNQPKLIVSTSCKTHCNNPKVYGDKYIASYRSGRLALFTQDSKFQLIGEYEVDLFNDGYYDMSEDFSNGLCFFNRDTGEICHNLI